MENFRKRYSCSYLFSQENMREYYKGNLLILVLSFCFKLLFAIDGHGHVCLFRNQRNPSALNIYRPSYSLLPSFNSTHSLALFKHQSISVTLFSSNGEEGASTKSCLVLVMRTNTTLFLLSHFFFQWSGLVHSILNIAFYQFFFLYFSLLLHLSALCSRKTTS